MYPVRRVHQTCRVYRESRVCGYQALLATCAVCVILSNVSSVPEMPPESPESSIPGTTTPLTLSGVSSVSTQPGVRLSRLCYGHPHVRHGPVRVQQARRYCRRSQLHHPSRSTSSTRGPTPLPGRAVSSTHRRGPFDWASARQHSAPPTAPVPRQTCFIALPIAER